MASRISVLNHYRPQIVYGRTAATREAAEFIASATSFSTADALGLMEALRAALIHYHLDGRGLRLDGLFTSLPSINYRGELDAAFRLDRSLKKSLNAGVFNARIRNRGHIGRTPAEVFALWNAEHPDDPVQ